MVDVAIMAQSAARREWLFRSVSNDPDLHVSAVAATFPFLRSLMSETPAHVAVIDTELQLGSSVSRDWLLELLDVVPIVLLCPESDPLVFQRVLQAGAGGIIESTRSSAQIVQAIRTVACGLIVLDADLSAHRSEDNTTIERLTSRENDVLRLLAEGMGNKEIAAHLSISEHTIKFHIRSILSKLGASSRTQAVSRGLRTGLIEL
jgi:two-component system, NarL family, response regulator YdfI